MVERWEQKSPLARAPYVARYTGGVNHEDRKADEQSELRFLGYGLPVLRKELAKTRQALVETGNWNAQLVDRLFRAASSTRTHDTLSILLMLLERLDLQTDLTWGDVARFAPLIDNWAHNDQLSQVFSRHFERENSTKKRQVIRNSLRKWNTSSNPWLRRLSLTSLFFYARFRKTFPQTQFVIQCVQNRLEDPHIYVQKGVGWCLRELDRADSTAQRKFVKANVHRISGVAWFATSELYPPSLKKQLVQTRKKARTR